MLKTFPCSVIKFGNLGVKETPNANEPRPRHLLIAKLCFPILHLMMMMTTQREHEREGKIKFVELQPVIIATKNFASRRRNGSRSAQRQLQSAKRAPSDEKATVSLYMFLYLPLDLTSTQTPIPLQNQPLQKPSNPKHWPPPSQHELHPCLNPPTKRPAALPQNAAESVETNTPVTATRNLLLSQTQTPIPPPPVPTAVMVPTAAHLTSTAHIPPPTTLTSPEPTTPVEGQNSNSNTSIPIERR